MTLKRIFRRAGSFCCIALAGLMLAGCSGASRDTSSLLPHSTNATQYSDGPVAEGMPVTKAAPATSTEVSSNIETGLACIRESGALFGKKVAIASWSDDTNKANIGPGGTGAFLPGGSSTMLGAYYKAGATPVSMTFSAKQTDEFMKLTLGQAATSGVVADFVAGGSWQSLDFNTTVAADVRVNGWGPTANYSQAQFTMATTISKGQIVANYKSLQRTVDFTQGGVGVGAAAGATLVTGNVAVSKQEMLQKSAQESVSLGVMNNIIYARSEDGAFVFPAARRKCKAMIDAMTGPERKLPLPPQGEQVAAAVLPTK